MNVTDLTCKYAFVGYVAESPNISQNINKEKERKMAYRLPKVVFSAVLTNGAPIATPQAYPNIRAAPPKPAK